MRFILLAATLCLGLAIGYVLGLNTAGRRSAPAPQAQIEAKVSAPAPVESPLPKPRPKPVPKAAPVTAQEAEAQVADDAAAVGMTTREPEPPATIDELLRDDASPAPPPQ